MSHFTLAPSGMVIDAFQWNGGNITSYVLPYWAMNLALQTPGDSTLDVPCWNGSFSVRQGDWVFQGPLGRVQTMTNILFTALFVPTA